LGRSKRRGISTKKNKGGGRKKRIEFTPLQKRGECREGSGKKRASKKTGGKRDKKKEEDIFPGGTEGTF